MIAVPLVVAALLLVLGRRSDAWGHVLATVVPIVSFVIGLVLFLSTCSDVTVRLVLSTWGSTDLSTSGRGICEWGCLLTSSRSCLCCSSPSWAR
ncbi:NADH-ubiquinone oxidoreductase [Cutibacterium acnes JCM 18909]|nr:NADH-ubiquinone oxidoreductase [Cutibacterium acnes JCM 18909]